MKSVENAYYSSQLDDTVFVCYKLHITYALNKTRGRFSTKTYTKMLDIYWQMAFSNFAFLARRVA